MPLSTIPKRPGYGCGTGIDLQKPGVVVRTHNHNYGYRRHQLFVSDVKTHTPDDSWKPNPLIYKM